MKERIMVIGALYCSYDVDFRTLVEGDKLLVIENITEKIGVSLSDDLQTQHCEVKLMWVLWSTVFLTTSVSRILQRLLER